MSLTNPVDTFGRGLIVEPKWWVWLILLALLALWLWRVDRDMKANGGEGLFSNMFDGLFDDWW